MKLRNNKLIKNCKSELESSIEFESEYSDSESNESISSSEIADLKKEASQPITIKSDLLNSLTLSDSDDEDYNPHHKSSIIDKKYNSVYKYFSLNEEEKRYFRLLSPEEKEKIIELKNNINSKNIERKPSIFQILESKIPLESKIEILKKFKESKIMEKTSTEYYKLQEYINGILRIPFNQYKDLYIENTSKYIRDSKNILDNIIFGHEKVKMHILEILGQYISAPKSVGNVFGIYGPMGIGKTTIIKDGLSEVLQRPFNFITLGGSSDSSFLDGHGYTYEGSKYGKIVEC